MTKREDAQGRAPGKESRTLNRRKTQKKMILSRGANFKAVPGHFLLIFCISGQLYSLKGEEQGTKATLKWEGVHN